MLSLIRNSKIGIILAIVFGISLFLIRGGNKYSGVFGVGANDIAAVGKIKISNIQFLRTFDLNKKRFNEMVGRDLNNQEIITLGINKQTLGILINEAILKNEFNKLDLHIDDSIIAETIKDYVPSIYDENNKIIEENLNTFLVNQNLDIENLIDIIKTQKIREHYENSLFNNISYSESSIKKINLINNHKRDIDYMIIPIKKMNIKVNKDKNILKKHFNDNIESYKTQETRDIEFIDISPKHFYSNFNFTDSEIKDYYDNNTQLFVTKEKRNFIQLNFKKKIDADNFKLILNNANNYEKIKNLALKNDIRFNEFKNINNNEILLEISNIVFDIDENKISEIIESPLAFHIIFVNKVTPKNILSLRNAKNKINNNLKDQYAINYIQNLLEKIDEDIINNLAINEISKKYGLNLNKLNKVNSNNNKDLEKLVIDKAFLEKENFTSDIHKGINENDYFIFNVTNITEPIVKDFKLIENIIYQDWKKIEEEKKSIELIKNELNNNEKESLITELSKKFKININNITTNIYDLSFPKNFLNMAFTNDIGKPYYQLINDEIYIGINKSIIIEDLTDNIEKEKNDIENNISNELKQSLIASLKKKTDIKINENLFNALTSNF